jgi:hypothetical protein
MTAIANGCWRKAYLGEVVLRFVDGYSLPID